MADKQTAPNETRTPELIDVRQVSDGWLKKYVLTYKLPNGEDYEYESISRRGLEEYRQSLMSGNWGNTAHADAVCIVPILPDDSLLLIREFRYAINDWMIAFPAGLMEPGEDIRDCIDRELKEETGYRVRRDFDGSPITLFPQSGHSSIGMSDENVSVVIAYVEPDGDADLQPTEFIEAFTLPRNDVANFLDTNEDPIGTRCQLLLEAIRRLNVLRKRIALAQNPIKSKDFA